jgi:hypothetical protein
MPEFTSLGGGGVDPSHQPKPILPGLTAADMASASPAGIEAALQTPVRTLGQLKELLIANLGEETGTKFYNSFMNSFGMLMIEQVRKAASSAQKAAQNMRAGNQ